MNTIKRMSQYAAATAMIVMLWALSAEAQTSGTPGKIPKFKSGSTFGNSEITEDKQGKIGIGTDLPTSKLTVAGVIEALNGFKFPDGTVQATAGIAPDQVVRSLNTLKGDVTLAAGTNIEIMPAGNTLTVAAPNALTSVAHGATLTGDGTAGSPLEIASPLAVRDLDNPARQPVEFTLDVTFGDTFTVPAGKRLVIEYVSGVFSIPTGGGQPNVRSVTVRSKLGIIGHNFPAYNTGDDGTAFIFFIIGQATRLYADPETSVSVSVTSLATTTFMTFSGHYVDVPQSL